MQGVVAPRAEADDVERMKAAMAHLERTQKELQNDLEAARADADRAERRVSDLEDELDDIGDGLFALDEHKIDLAKAYTAIRCGRSDDAARLIETVLSHIDSAWRTYA